MKDSIFVWCGGRFRKIRVSSVIFVHSVDGCTKLVTTEGVISTRAGLRQLERFLTPNLFCRVHETCMVAINQISSFDTGTVQAGGYSIPLTKQYREELKSRVRILAQGEDDGVPFTLAIGNNGRLIELSADCP